jgi:hypothetical protein
VGVTIVFGSDVRRASVNTPVEFFLPMNFSAVSKGRAI